MITQRLLSVVLTASLAVFSGTPCNALSPKFYEDYVEAQSLLRGGGRMREFHLIHGRQKLLEPKCTMDEPSQLQLCRLDFGGRETPQPPTFPDTPMSSTTPVESSASSTIATITASATSSNVGSSLSIPIVNDTSTRPKIATASANITEANPNPNLVPRNTASANERVDTKREPNAYYSPSMMQATGTNSSQEAIGPYPTSYSAGTEWYAWLEQTITADSAGATAGVKFRYEREVNSLVYEGNFEGSIGTWTTSTKIHSGISIDSIPQMSLHATDLATSDFGAVITRFASLCGAVEPTGTPRGPRPIQNETDAVYTSSATSVYFGGTFRGTVIYQSATASWDACWGAYDLTNHSFPFQVTFFGADGGWSSRATESWIVSAPFVGPEGHEVDHLADGGIAYMISYLSQWNGPGYKFAGPTLDVQATDGANGYPNATLTGTTIAPMTKDSTVIQPAVTDTIAATGAQINTLVPRTDDKGTHERDAGDEDVKGTVLAILVPWLASVGALLACAISVVGCFYCVCVRTAEEEEEEEDDDENARGSSDQAAEQGRENEDTLTAKPNTEPKTSSTTAFGSSILNLFPRHRKTSGSEIVDSEKIGSLRNRAVNPDTFNTVKL
ncbi:hypothetical protein DRE_00039 [Drechslerella stenobrocha 248]|uniref:Peptidase A1 domain-containing protein n=1 Tax=Drechslerella stenobrocha 248 TaxID=1043628 RepID=W7HYZ5_9PEZI|nr:hypothetical protein DRE_00039 [Drechslerella stenobrocha 248]